jgi:hypothetical protein
MTSRNSEFGNFGHSLAARLAFAAAKVESISAGGDVAKW